MLTVAVMYVMINLVIDILCGVIDPRVHATLKRLKTALSHYLFGLPIDDVLLLALLSSLISRC